MARLTGLEPATPGVTGRYSNQLSYNRATEFEYFRAGKPSTSIVNDAAHIKTKNWRRKCCHATKRLRKRSLMYCSGGAVDGARTRDPRRDRPVL